MVLEAGRVGQRGGDVAIGENCCLGERDEDLVDPRCPEDGTNARVIFRERLVLPRVEDLITAIMELLQRQVPGEGLELLTLDFRDAFKQLHMVPSERPFLAGEL